MGPASGAAVRNDYVEVLPTFCEHAADVYRQRILHVTLKGSNRAREAVRAEVEAPWVRQPAGQRLVLVRHGTLVDVLVVGEPELHVRPAPTAATAPTAAAPTVTAPAPAAAMADASSNGAKDYDSLSPAEQLAMAERSLRSVMDDIRGRDLFPHGTARHLVRTAASTESSSPPSVSEPHVDVHVDLNPFNHAVQRFGSVSELRRVHAAYCAFVSEATSHLEDGITGNRLRTVDQLMNIDLSVESARVAAAAYTSAPNIRALAAPMLASSPGRAHGTHHVQPVLLCARPGTGKTWSAVQLVHELAQQAGGRASPVAPGGEPAGERAAGVRAGEPAGVPMVPVIIFVQRFQRMLMEQPADATLDVRVVLQYFAREYREHPQRGDFLNLLAMAIEMRTLVLVLDGIDEAARLKDNISRLVREHLVPMGIRLLCTSRPEGVNREDFRAHFVILDLKPLSDEQQKEAISRQLDEHPLGKAFSEHLLAFVAIRKGHDEIYQGVFNTVHRRRAIESFLVPNRFELQPPQLDDAGIARLDPQMRQHNTDGTVAALHTGPPRSRYLADLSAYLAPALLEAVDQAVESLGARPTDEAVLEAASAAIGGFGGSEAHAKVAAKLGLLAAHRRALVPGFERLRALPTPSDDEARTLALHPLSAVSETRVSALWPVLVSRTDQIYVVCEQHEKPFQAALRALVTQLGLDPAASITFASGLKDPVRMHEKALNDYAGQHDDLADPAVALPEAAVIDVIRARVVVPTGRAMLEVQQRLAEGFVHTYGGGGEEGGGGGEVRIELELVRCKNKVANMDPTHFRNLLNNLRMTVSEGGRVHRSFVEVQVHHERILKYNEQADAHAHYDFFRALLAGAYDAGLDEARRCRRLEPGTPPCASPALPVLRPARPRTEASSGRHRCPSEATPSRHPTPPVLTRRAPLAPADRPQALERALVFLDELSGVPVLLSMLVLILKHSTSSGGGGAGGHGRDALPTDRYELYKAAIERSVAHHPRCAADPAVQARAIGMLRRVALANQLDTRREFTPRQVAACLDPTELEEWRIFTALEGGVPLVKTLVDDTDDRGLYQFKHLSFQEALATQAVVADRAASWPSWRDDTAAAEFLQLPFNLNMCVIGGCRLGQMLGSVRSSWELRGKVKPAAARGKARGKAAREQRLADQAVAEPAKEDASLSFVPLEEATGAIVPLLVGNREVETLTLDVCALPMRQLTTTKPLPKPPRFDLNGDAMESTTGSRGQPPSGRASLMVIGELVGANEALTDLHVTGRGLGAVTGTVAAHALRCNPRLSSLSIARCTLLEVLTLPPGEAAKVSLVDARDGQRWDERQRGKYGERTIAELDAELEPSRSSGAPRSQKPSGKPLWAPVVGQRVDYPGALPAYAEATLWARERHAAKAKGAARRKGVVTAPRWRGFVASVDRDDAPRQIVDYVGLFGLIEAVAMSRSLTSLDVGGNGLGDYGAEVVATHLLHDCVLVMLGLSENGITDRGAALLLDGFSAAASLRACELLRNWISSAMATRLAGAAQSRQPALAMCGIREDAREFTASLAASDAVLLGADLAIRPELTSVDTRGSSLDAEGATQLAAAVVDRVGLRVFNGIELEELRRASATTLTLPRDADLAQVNVLAALIPKNTALARVDARASKAAGRAAELLSVAVLACPSVVECLPIPVGPLRANKLESLDLSGEGLGQTELRVLAGLLPVATTLQSLNIRGSSCGDAELRAMGDALLSTPDASLKFLSCDAFSLDHELSGDVDLSAHDLRGGAMVLLSSMLKHTGREITGLDLSCNQFGDEGASSLATGLMPCSKLRSLNVCSCGIGSGGAKALSAALTAVETILLGWPKRPLRRAAADDADSLASPFEVPVMVGCGDHAVRWDHLISTVIITPGWLKDDHLGGMVAVDDVGEEEWRSLTALVPGYTPSTTVRPPKDPLLECGPGRPSKALRKAYAEMVQAASPTFAEAARNRGAAGPTAATPAPAEEGAAVGAAAVAAAVRSHFYREDAAAWADRVAQACEGLDERLRALTVALRVHGVFGGGSSVASGRLVFPTGFAERWKLSGESEAAARSVTVFVSSTPAYGCVRYRQQQVMSLLAALKLPHEIVDLASLEPAERAACVPREVEAPARLPPVHATEKKSSPWKLSPCGLLDGTPPLTLPRIRLGSQLFDRDELFELVDCDPGRLDEMATSAFATAPAAGKAAAQAPAAATLSGAT